MPHGGCAVAALILSVFVADSAKPHFYAQAEALYMQHMDYKHDTEAILEIARNHGIAIVEIAGTVQESKSWKASQLTIVLYNGHAYITAPHLVRSNGKSNTRGYISTDSFKTIQSDLEDVKRITLSESELNQRLLVGWMDRISPQVSTTRDTLK